MVKNFNKVFSPSKSNTPFSEGHKSKGILDDYALRKVVDTIQGTIDHTPTNPKDIANKAYVDASGSGDNLGDHIATQTISGSNIVMSGNVDAVNIEAISGATLINTNNLTTLSGAHYTHVGDSSDPHGSLLTQTDITSSGAISGAHLIRTGDFETISGAYICNVVYGTEETPPTASNFTRGSVYLQYTP